MKQLAHTLLIAASLGGLSLGQAPDVELGKPTRARCDAWVQQLANRSPRPFAESSVDNEPKNVDKKALADVKEAYDQLSSHFTQSLPALTAGLPDRRYSHYQEIPSNGCFICMDVGSACEKIIEAHVEIYRRYLTVLDSTDVPRSVDFLSAMGGAEKWHRSRTDKPLFDLQLEAIDWALKQAAPPTNVREPDWTIAIDSLKKFREEFVKNKSAINPNHTLRFRCP